MRDYERSWGSLKITMDHAESPVAEGDGTSYDLFWRDMRLGTFTALEIEHLHLLLSENLEEILRHNAVYKRTVPKPKPVKTRPRAEIVRAMRDLLQELEASNG